MPSSSLTYDSDQVLAAEMVSGSRTAFDKVYRAYAAALLGYIEKSIVEKASAEKVLHRAFLEIWSNRAAFDPAKERLFSWLLKQARKTVINYNTLKQNKTVANPQTSSSVHIYDVSKKNELELSKKALELVYYNNFSLKDAAGILGINEKEMKVMLRHGIKNLKTLPE
jgi:DNA-directed RNA polymerase specialized sigma24 family protein